MLLSIVVVIGLVLFFLVYNAFTLVVWTILSAILDAI